MGIFKRTKNRAATVGAGLFTEPERARVDALCRLTALPRAEFDATYGDLLARCWRCRAWRQGLDGIEGEGADLRDRRVEGAPGACAAAVRRRRGRRPPGRGDELRARRRRARRAARAPAWPRLAAGWRPATEDVPASGLLEDVSVPRSYGALLLPRLVGDAGLRWLGQEPIAMRALAAYFGGGPSELRAIAEEAAARIGLPIPDTPKALDRSIASAAGGSCDGGVNGSEGCARCMEASRAWPETSGENETSGAVLVGGIGAGWRWINWVRAGLRDGSIAANADSGWLHHLGGDAYVVRPACFEEYAVIEGVEPGTIKNRVAKLRQHRLRKCERGVANTFRAELRDGRRVEGMVFPGELIWNDDPPPLAGAETGLGARRRRIGGERGCAGSVVRGRIFLVTAACAGGRARPGGRQPRSLRAWGAVVGARPTLAGWRRRKGRAERGGAMHLDCGRNAPGR